MAVCAAANMLAADRPNVVYILCDDLRPDALGCYGSPHVRTPHIDALAAEGVRFKNTFCTTSLCSPSRASILSGLYAHAHGVVNNFTEYPTSLASFPTQLHDAGYATAYVGKWHMGEENDSPRPGFDYFVTHKGQGKYFDTEFNLNGRERKVLPGYYTNVVTGLALDWLKQQRAQPQAEKPWLLCLGHKAPHSFNFPEAKYAHAFDDVNVQYPASAFHLDDKPAWIRQRRTTWHGIYGPLFEWRKKFPDDRPEAVKDFAAMTHAYWGTILSVDDSVGQLVGYLRDSGQLDRTLVVFMGDNGLLNGEHGMVDKRTMHEPSIRIPLIVRYPGLTKTPRVVEQQVLTVDVAPSVLELCGAPPLAKIHGKSWVALASKGDPAWRKSWFYEYNYEKQFPFTPNVRGVRTETMKYIHYPPGDGTPDKHMAELYNLAVDPNEDTNLIGDPAYADRLSQLKNELDRRMEETGLTAATDKMPLDEGIKQTLPDQKIR
jgi:N-acetylglucosamine-6-sulfatase